jgi:RimJ/RimL family protein N-acetyltransferase
MAYVLRRLDRRESDGFVDRIEKRSASLGFGLWALELRARGQFIGFSGLYPMPAGIPGAGGMEVGSRLAADAGYHGYSTEAARVALRVALEGVGLPEIWSVTATLKVPSAAVMRCLGLRVHGFAGHPGVEVVGGANRTVRSRQASTDSRCRCPRQRRARPIGGKRGAWGMGVTSPA